MKKMQNGPPRSPPGLAEEGFYTRAYDRAALKTGIPAAVLRAYAVRVFGSMLLHATRCETVWTQTRILDGRLDLEVNSPPRPARRLRMLLSAAKSGLSALNEELGANTDDDHPVIVSHRAVAKKLEAAIAKAEGRTA